ncbi:MAG: host attachment protein, partial [Steroidobacteraceae bacterium]
PKAHLHDRELVSDRPGRIFDHASGPGRRGATARHATGSERTPRKIEAQRFARKIIAALVKARRREEFEWLVVMAAPRFLGLLRAAMPAQLRSSVAAEIAKDLVHEPPAAVQWYLPPNACALYRPAAQAARRR